MNGSGITYTHTCLEIIFAGAIFSFKLQNPFNLDAIFSLHLLCHFPLIAQSSTKCKKHDLSLRVHVAWGLRFTLSNTAYEVQRSYKVIFSTTGLAQTTVLLIGDVAPQRFLESSEMPRLWFALWRVLRH